jgi:ech hydrogenase subunit C
MQADIFLITGGINTQNQAVVKQLYDQMPRPKVVVAVGVCACTGGVFKECYNIIGGADTTIPVDIYVPGCAARPQAIIDGIVKAIALWQEKADKMDRIQKELKQSDKEEKKAAREAAKAAKNEVKEETAEAAEEVVEEVAEVAEVAEKEETVNGN